MRRGNAFGALALISRSPHAHFAPARTKKIPRASLNDPRVEFRPSRRTTRELIAEHAIFSVHVLTIDRLQTPEAARRRAVVHRGPGRVALRRAHTLLSVDMQAA